MRTFFENFWEKIDFGLINTVLRNSTALFPSLQLDKKAGDDMLAKLGIPQKDGNNEVDDTFTVPADDRHASNESHPGHRRSCTSVICHMHKVCEADTRIFERVSEGDTLDIIRLAVENQLSVPEQHLNERNKMTTSTEIRG